MSCDWNIHCVDCNATHEFDDANHQDELMLHICRHADAIASIADLMTGKDGRWIELRTSYGQIEPAWFKRHMGHNLMPISEYGDLLDQCGEYVRCSCGSSRRCTGKLGHDGEHAVTEAPRR